MLTTCRLLSLIAAIACLCGCDELGGFSDSQRYKEDFHNTYELKPGGRLYVENINGPVEITGWEKNTVDVVGTKYAAEESALKGMRIDVVASPDSISIRTVRPSGYRWNLGARYVIRVPKHVVLDRITSSNGAIRVESVEGDARLKTSNGSVRVAQLKGRLEVQTSNGGVEVTDQEGGATINTSNGRVRADGIRGSFEATTSNGPITARLMDPEATRPVKLDSSNGSIDLTMDNLKDNEIRASTSNSSITLRLPQSLQAQLRAHTSNGHITSDFDVLVRGGQISKTKMEGAIGSGGPLVDLSTSNGSIKLLKL